MASGEFVPMVSLDHPEALENLHRDFQHAGSNIVEAFELTISFNWTDWPYRIFTRKIIKTILMIFGQRTNAIFS
jgi:methionine synthase I (cobalamin-dependent)